MQLWEVATYISVFGRGLEGGGGTFRLLNVSLTFKSPDA